MRFCLHMTLAVELDVKTTIQKLVFLTMQVIFLKGIVYFMDWSHGVKSLSEMEWSLAFKEIVESTENLKRGYNLSRCKRAFLKKCNNCINLLSIIK